MYAPSLRENMPCSGVKSKRSEPYSHKAEVFALSIKLVSLSYKQLKLIE